MRIWHLNLTRAQLRVDGIAAAVQRLARAQQDAGAEVRVFSRGGSAALAEIRDALAIPGAHPDVAHLHSVFRPLHAVVARRLRRLGIPYVISPHSGYAPPSLERRRRLKGVYARMVERPLVAGASLASCLTDVERDDLHRFSPDFTGTDIIVPNPLEQTLSTRAWTRPPGRPTVVTLCRYDVRQKGLDRLADVARDCPGVDFVVHGEQDKNEHVLTSEVRRSAPPNFTLRPPVFGPEKDAALAGATLFALVSRWEGLSMSLAEALAGGVPCAVSSYVGSTLPFSRKGLGLVLDDDADTAARQVREAIADPDALAEWSRAGRAYAAKEFSPVAIAERTLAGYRSVASGATR